LLDFYADLWEAAAVAQQRGSRKANEFYVPEGGGGRPQPDARRRRTPAASVVPGSREQRQLAAAAGAGAASGSEVHVVGEGGGRHHAVVVHPGRADGRRAGADRAAEEAVVEAGARGAVKVPDIPKGIPSEKLP